VVGQPGFFDADARLQALSAAGDPLERLAAVVDFELFRPDLEATLARADRSRGGRRPPRRSSFRCDGGTSQDGSREASHGSAEPAHPP
jgi:hypothetical protein